MKIETAKEQGTVILKLIGEVDLSCAQDARGAILKEIREGESLLVDLSETEYMDSSGVACLVEGMQASEKKGGEFALLGINDTIREVLEIAKLDQIFRLFASREEWQESRGKEPGA